MATLTKSNNDNFLTWQKVNGTLHLSRLQSRGIPPCFEGYNISDLTSKQAASVQTGPFGLFWSADGYDVYYIASAAANNLYQETVTTPFDISSISTNQNHSISEDSSATGFAFSTDGTKLYIVGTTNDTIYQYTLSTAWDVSTIGYDSVSFDISSQTTSPAGMHFSDTHVYLIGGNTIYQYTWTPGTISTCVYVDSFSITGATFYDVFYNDETLYVTDIGNDLVYKISMSSGDLKRAAVIDSATIVTGAKGIYIDEGGFNMWTCKGSDELNEYWIGCP